MSANELLDSAYPFDYVFVRARGVLVIMPDGSIQAVSSDEARRVSDPLTDSLLWSDPSSVPDGFQLVAEVPVPGAGYPYARIWKVVRPRDPD